MLRQTIGKDLADLAAMTKLWTSSCGRVSIVIFVKSSLPLKVKEDLARFNDIDKSGHKQLWTCVYRFKYDRISKALR
jgi:hypothetical protein